MYSYLYSAISVTVLFINVLGTTRNGYQQNLHKTSSVAQLIASHGYPVEIHKVATADGYILTAQRIPHGKDSSSKSPGEKVALLVHGMGGSAENYVTIGPNKALAFILADRGFDVWLFNARGTTDSRNHRTLPSYFFEAATFWNFSWHHIGVYDLPANIDYILKKTRKNSLFYVGHSQGATSYFVMTSERPEYNRKIKVAALMAPAVLLRAANNYIFKILSVFHPVLEQLADLTNYHELPAPNYPLFKEFLRELCLLNNDFMDACTNMFYFLGGLDSGLFNASLVPQILTNNPASFGSRQALHYAQVIKSGKFRKYDYGVQGNLIRYYQKRPPDYNLSNSVAPVANFFGNGDGYVPSSVKDELAKMLPNVVLSYEVPYDRFNHLDFIWGSNVEELVYEPIYELFMRFNDS